MHLPQMLAEFYRCGREIEDERLLMAAAEAAAARIGATVISRSAVTYQPHGATVGVFLAESHIILTTWPEFRLLLVDSLLCNLEMSQHAVLDEIGARLCPEGKVVTHEVTRFLSPEPPEGALAVSPIAPPAPSHIDAADVLGS